MFQTHASGGQFPGGVAILPLGATETHGPHLPLETDTLIVEGILDAASALHKSSNVILRLPPVRVGASAEHADRPGTLSIEPEELIVQIVGIGETLARSGVRRVVLFNGHGGNIAAAAIAALKLRMRFDMLAASAHWLDFGLPETLTPPTPAMADVHGGWIETSVLLHLVPNQVRTAPPQVGKTPAPSLFPTGPIAWGWKTSDIAPDGYIGRPDLANVTMGRALVDHAAQKLLRLIEEMAAATWPPC